MPDIIETSNVTNTDIVYQQDKAAVDIQIATAKAYPRNLKRSLDNAIAIVTMDKETASTCTYALPRAGKNISGPSVHLAKILAQNWGNLRIEAKVVDISQKHITCQAVAFDLENNLAIKVEVKRSILTRSGRMNDDMITVTGNAGNAIALRNAIFGVIPRNIVDKVYNSALQTITGDLSSENKFISQRKLLIEFFNTKYGVDESEVLLVFGKASITNITREDLVTLHGIGQAIKDGDTSVEEAFRKNKKPVEIKNTDNRSELTKFIETEALSVEALEAIQGRLKTDEERKAYAAKLSSIKKPTTNV